MYASFESWVDSYFRLLHVVGGVLNTKGEKIAVILLPPMPWCDVKQFCKYRALVESNCEHDVGAPALP